MQVYVKDSQEPALVVLDDVDSLPQLESLQPLLKAHSTHIIVISHASQPPEELKKAVDQQLIRGCTLISIQPLSTVHATQRIVHCIMSHTHFIPLNREQKLLERTASLTSGCPGLVAMTNSLLEHCLLESKQQGEADFLTLFASKVHLTDEQPSPVYSATGEARPVRARAGSFKTDRYVSELISAFELPPTHLFVLRTLSIFSPQPLPFSLVEIIQYLAAKATQSSTVPTNRSAPNSISNLLSTKLLRPYPSPIISPPINLSSPQHSTSTPTLESQDKYLYVPQLVQDTLWDEMDNTDIAFSITTAYRAILELTSRPDLSRSGLSNVTGLTETLIAQCDSNRECISDAVYREIYRTLISLQIRSNNSRV